MWSQNAFTERLNLKWPILQAPMGNISTPALAAAVTMAGGLGGIGMWGFSADDARRRIAGFRQQAPGSLNVNYPLWGHTGDLAAVGPAMRERIAKLHEEAGLQIADPTPSAGEVSAEHLAVLIEAKPEAVSFHFGLPPADILRPLKSAGIFILSSATTVAEARWLEAQGVDAVIAQGTEAGGHRGTFTGVDVGMQPGLFSLLPQVVDAVKVPVLAAGGIADGRGIAAALMLGASGVQLGTAFLRCGEANVYESHRMGLRTADDSNTVVTSAVSGRPARFVQNRLVRELMRPGAEPLPFPAQLGLTYPMGEGGDPALAALFAGQSTALTREMPAAEIMAALAEETTRCLKRFA